MSPPKPVEADPSFVAGLRGPLPFCTGPCPCYLEPRFLVMQALLMRHSSPIALHLVGFLLVFNSPSLLTPRPHKQHQKQELWLPCG